jgi:hypothetical protein
LSDHPVYRAIAKRIPDGFSSDKGKIKFMLLSIIQTLAL